MDIDKAISQWPSEKIEEFNKVYLQYCESRDLAFTCGVSHKEFVNLLKPARIKIKEGVYKLLKDL